MPGRASARKKRCSKTLHDGTTKHGHITARSTVLAAPQAMVKDKSGEGVQPAVLQRGWASMARKRSKSQDVRAATWNVSSMVGRSGEVVDALHRRKIDLCCAQEDSRIQRTFIRQQNMYINIFFNIEKHKLYINIDRRPLPRCL